MIRFPALRVRRISAVALAVAPGIVGTTIAMSAVLLGATAAHAQAVYPTPDAAANAFVDALAANNGDALKHVLGNDYTRFIPTKDVGEDDIYDFLAQWAKGHEIVDDPAPLEGRLSKHLSVGTDGWTLPIPLVQTSHGWRFDPVAGQDEILTRRIGRNEHAAIMTALAYVDAQHDYNTLNQQYAQRLISTPGQHDGLYWPAAPGEAESPLGPLAAVMPPRGSVINEGYYGYHFRILTAQGQQAKGGAQNYVDGGKLMKGFGLVAWPAEYGRTGVMSFIVNQDGQVYQKNLGPHSADAAAALRLFNPDPSWQPVQP